MGTAWNAGHSAAPVDVQVQPLNGLPACAMVELPDYGAVASQERVRASPAMLWNGD